MPTPNRIVVYFDDGSSQEINVRGMSSVFFRENAAVKCGRKPPYKQGQPPKGGDSSTSTLSAMSSTSGTSSDTTTANAMADGETCYWINGIIVCP